MAHTCFGESHSSVLQLYLDGLGYKIPLIEELVKSKKAGFQTLERAQRLS